MVKINKKDKLAAMLQMWTVLREIGKTRPWASKSNEHNILCALEVELASMLGLPKKVHEELLPRDQIILLVENLKKVREEFGTLRTENNARYGGSEMLNALIGMLEDKLKPAIPVPADFELPSPESE